MTTKFTYRRQDVLQHMQKWLVIPNPTFPNFSLSTGNNANFVYQCLYKGGYGRTGSGFTTSVHPALFSTIIKTDVLKAALEHEIGANVIINNGETPPILGTGDVVIIEKNNSFTAFMVENQENVNYYYSKDPSLSRVAALPAADQYFFYYIPDTGTWLI